MKSVLAVRYITKPHRGNYCGHILRSLDKGSIELAYYKLIDSSKATNG